MLNSNQFKIFIPDPLFQAIDLSLHINFKVLEAHKLIIVYITDNSCFLVFSTLY